MKTLIGIPCMDQVAAQFAHSLASLNKVGECEIDMIIGSLIYEARNDIVKQAIKKDVDYVMWFDSDMLFPADTLERMIKHMEDGKDIVTGIYFRRRAPFTPVLFSKLDLANGKCEGCEDYPEDAPFEVDGCGFGCVIVRKTVLLDMMLNYRTWFNPEYGCGEDLAFCRRAKELGYKIWADPSIKCGHVGQVIVDEKVYKANFAPGKNEESNA